ncbi:Histone deacetylase-like amidohydrolase [Thalassocella blandensis]|nr:Histone deacetylase-like amidohydrolase [Thalassocella blandensis]
MTTAYISHHSFFDHEMGEGHPECPQRLTAIQDTLVEQQIFDFLLQLDPVKADVSLLKQVHTPEYIDWLFKHGQISDGYFHVDDETTMNAHTLTAAQFAAGAGVVAIDGLFSGRFKNAFCAVRPPGHHAEKNESMGFSFFNNVVVAATYAQQKYQLKRIAIIDFDVHHGNGTEDIIGDDSGILYCSSYQHPLFPHTVVDHKKTNCVHCPLSAGTRSEGFRKAYEDTIFPAVDSFKPEIILVSAGFDGHIQDPMANWLLTEADYNWVTEEIIRLADTHCDGKIVSFLEGGYDLPALGRSVCGHVRLLANL